MSCYEAENPQVAYNIHLTVRNYNHKLAPTIVCRGGAKWPWHWPESTGLIFEYHKLNPN